MRKINRKEEEKRDSALNLIQATIKWKLWWIYGYQNQTIFLE